MTRKVVLVTGATGLIGWPTLPHIAPLGFSAIGMARHGAAGCLVGDLFDPARIRAILAEVRPTHILHLAWDVTPGKFVHAVENLDYVAATLSFARAAAAAGVQRFVGVGTCAEYDWTDGNAPPRRETDPINPDSLYGIAKDSTQRMLAALFRKENISFAWARSFHMFGPGESPLRLIGGLVDKLRHNQTFTVRHGQLVRDFIATADLGEALARLVASPTTGPVNVASGEPITLGNMVRYVANHMNRPHLVDIHEDPAPNLPLHMLANVTRLRTEVECPTPPSVWQRLSELAS